MVSRTVVVLLRILLIGALVLTAVLQLGVLPWFSGVVAQEYPAEAFMRWPILALAVLGLACVEVVIVCMLRLLSFTVRDQVFSSGALRWVDGIIGAFVAGAVVCLSTIVYQSFTVAGPPAWMLLLIFGVIGGIGLALLMIVMRGLLLQAANLRTELSTVI